MKDGYYWEFQSGTGQYNLVYIEEDLVHRIHTIPDHPVNSLCRFERFEHPRAESDMPESIGHIGEGSEDVRVQLGEFNEVPDYATKADIQQLQDRIGSILDLIGGLQDIQSNMIDKVTECRFDIANLKVTGNE